VTPDHWKVRNLAQMNCPDYEMPCSDNSDCLDCNEPLECLDPTNNLQFLCLLAGEDDPNGK
ncbi:Hypothetical predicted protein, partial [Paramuricea clavata]